MHHPTDRIIHTTAFVTPVVEHWLEREIAQWVHPMKDRSDSHRTMSERTYHGAISCSFKTTKQKTTTKKQPSLNSYQETCMAHNYQKARLSASHAGHPQPNDENQRYDNASNGRK